MESGGVVVRNSRGCVQTCSFSKSFFSSLDLWLQIVIQIPIGHMIEVKWQFPEGSGGPSKCCQAILAYTNKS